MGRPRILEEEEEDVEFLPRAGERRGADPARQHRLPQRVQSDIPALQDLQ